jgi:hypothetical protein
MKDPRRWILILVGLSLVVSVLVTRNRRVEKVEGGPCLVQRDCLSAQRCLVIPASDGFATDGRCVDPCPGGDLSCPAKYRCEAVYEAGGYLVPKGARGATAQVVEVCVPGARQN